VSAPATAILRATVLAYSARATHEERGLGRRSRSTLNYRHLPLNCGDAELLAVRDDERESATVEVP
jgi:hypothetical protein